MPYPTNSWDMWIDIILMLFFTYLGVYPTTYYRKSASALFLFAILYML